MHQILSDLSLLRISLDLTRCDFQLFLQINKPRPRPSFLQETKGLNKSFSTSFEIPIPLSQILIVPSAISSMVYSQSGYYTKCVSAIKQPIKRIRKQIIEHLIKKPCVHFHNDILLTFYKVLINVL